MHPIRKQRLIWIAVITLCISAAVALALYALRQNIDLFFTPSQLVRQPIPNTQSIRVGGWVVEHSVLHVANPPGVGFAITDHEKTLRVYYDGILPDLFREGQAVVVEGTLDARGVFLAREVLAKHDENYTPPALRPPVPTGSQ